MCFNSKNKKKKNGKNVCRIGNNADKRISEFLTKLHSKCFSFVLWTLLKLQHFFLFVYFHFD